MNRIEKRNNNPLGNKDKMSLKQMMYMCILLIGLNGQARFHYFFFNAITAGNNLPKNNRKTKEMPMADSSFPVFLFLLTCF